MAEPSLREQVAMKLGWKRTVYPDMPVHRREMWDSPDGIYCCYGGDTLPAYDESFAGCEEVLAWLTARGWQVRLLITEDGSVCKLINERLGISGSRVIESAATTLPLALCRAFVQIGETP